MAELNGIKPIVRDHMKAGSDHRSFDRAYNFLFLNNFIIIIMFIFIVLFYLLMFIFSGE